MPKRFRGKHVDFRIGYAKAPKIRDMGTNLDLFALRKDGSEFPIDVSLSPFNIGEDRLIIAMLRDVTERKKTEKEIERQRNILAKLDRNALMGQLTGAIAHELNQPLTSVLSNAQAAEIMFKSENWDVEEFKEILIDIINDTKRGAEIIRNVREMYREQKVEFLPFNLIETINNTIRLLNSDLVMQNIVIDIKCTASIPILNGNKIQIQQVILNMIINSIEAMKNNNRTNRLIQIQITNNDNEVRTTVADSGTGIKVKESNNIFKPFVTLKPGGTGMGLAVSNSIIVSHGGRMWSENRLEGGALVGFSLPLIKKEF
jgi:two-component system sensor kinase FixL